MADSGFQNFKIDTQGRTLIPKNVREALNITNGDELVGRLEGNQLILESRQSLLERLQARYADVETSLASELIADRREDAARE